MLSRIKASDLSTLMFQVTWSGLSYLDHRKSYFPYGMPWPCSDPRKGTIICIKLNYVWKPRNGLGLPLWVPLAIPWNHGFFLMFSNVFFLHIVKKNVLQQYNKQPNHYVKYVMSVLSCPACPVRHGITFLILSVFKYYQQNNEPDKYVDIGCNQLTDMLPFWQEPVLIYIFGLYWVIFFSTGPMKSWKIYPFI